MSRRAMKKPRDHEEVRMPKRSAGLLIYRRHGASLEIFLVHPGGPFWKNKDAGAWSVPKGEYTDAEDPLAAAGREFEEETGFTAAGPFLPLGEVRQAGGKIVTVWAMEGSFDPAQLRSNTFLLEWPPRSGRQVEFPEVDRAKWFSLAEAREKLLSGQLPFLDRLTAKLLPEQPG
jgi:predicted NUDIX family NTP pyrophosphohydrolase